MIESFIAAPLVGGVIGYITNAIAIRMLFRPFEPVYLFGRRLPLTPGLIPKEKGRLARAVGEIVASRLLNAETLESALTSPQMLARVEQAVDQALERAGRDRRTLGEISASIEGCGRAVERAADLAARALARRLAQAGLGDVAARAVMEHFKKKSPAALNSLARALFDHKFKQNITRQLAAAVNNYIANNAQEFTQAFIRRETGRVLDERVCDLAARHARSAGALRPRLTEAYARLVRSAAPGAIAAVDLKRVVSEKIDALSARELEALVMSVMKRELRAIVYLGAALGFLMGFVNLLFA